MRLRWPYVRRTVGAALHGHGLGRRWPGGAARDAGASLQERVPADRRGHARGRPVQHHRRAGSATSSISSGGGYTVDGACSSSLLSVATACNALADGTADAAIAGGVDLSIDPFEIIGFAKTGALATGEMRVYDQHSNGFWPGEGCGMLVLMREHDAEARGLRVYATIAGWGYSSDGRGGITRPEAERPPAGDRPGVPAGGLRHRLRRLPGRPRHRAPRSATRRSCGPSPSTQRPPARTLPPALISTVKGNIGHTKAAAGVAGLIKATHGGAPPGDPSGHWPRRHRTRCSTRSHPALRVPLTARAMARQPARAGRGLVDGLRRDQRARRAGRRYAACAATQPRRLSPPGWSGPARTPSCCCLTPAARPNCATGWPAWPSWPTAWHSPSSATWPRPWRAKL